MRTAFTVLDWGLLLIFLLSLILGIMKGLVRELFSLGFLILAVGLGYRLSTPASHLLYPVIKEPLSARFLAFVIILLLVIVIGIWVTWLVKKIFIHGVLTFADRTLGGGLGALRGLLLCAVLLLAMSRLPAGRHLINRSFLAPVLESGLKAALRLLPNKIEKRMERYWQHANEENSRDRRTV